MEESKKLIQRERHRLIRQASLIALWGNAFLAALKIAAGLLAGSLAVLGDGIDSSTDVAIAAMSLFVAGIIARPADREHPFGHGRAETIATSILSFILFFAGSQLIIQAVGFIVRHEERGLPGPLALVVTGISIAGKLALALNQYALGRKSASTMLIANAKNMRNDVVISASVIVGLSLSLAFHLPILDPVVAILVGLWIIKSAFGIFMEANLELMDGSRDPGLYEAVFEAVRMVPGAENPHRARMRCIAGAWDIDLDIEVAPSLSVQEAHDISIAVEEAIRERVDPVFDIMVHIEPAGCEVHNKGETWGLKDEGIPAAGDGNCRDEGPRASS